MLRLKSRAVRIAKFLLSGGRSITDIKRKVTRESTARLSTFLSSTSQLVFTPPDNPELSIVIVLYNRAELTFDCLKALQTGTYKNFEVVAIDNASNDGTQELFSKTDGIRYVRNDTNLHFLRGSNQGASLAKGEYLLFLNSDAAPEPEAIQNAMHAIRADSSIGALGAKLILPGGRLQEAGSIVWQDGTCLGYGRGDKPDRAQYMFRREVDYCSGAFLLTPRALFKRLGGFDLEFAPAYYEETDYCLRLQAAGYRVVFEPAATVKHFEFASQASADALAMQIERREILCRKHAAVLKEHLPPAPENILPARTSLRQNRRLLFIDERLPHFHTGAGYPRANQMIRAAIEAGWFVSVYPAIHVDREENWETVYSDIPREAEVLAFPPYGPRGLLRLLRERQGYYHSILISRPTTMRLIRPLLKKHADLFSGAKLIYDAEAIFSLRENLYAGLKGQPFSAQELQAKIRAELSLAQGISCISAVCRHEADKFREYGFSDVHVASHAVSVREHTPSFNSRDSILFVGAIHDDSGPNADSIFWFLENVLPRLRQEGLMAEFLIAGTNHSRRMRALQLSGVKVLSHVPDLSSVYDRARIFVAPTRFSAGIPLKVIEAAANGVPVVASQLVSEQLGWKDGLEIEVCRDAAEFSQRCRALFSDEARWNHIRWNSLTRVAAEYSRASLQASMSGILLPSTLKSDSWITK